MRTTSKRKSSSELSFETMRGLQLALSGLDRDHDILIDLDGKVERVERPLPMKPIPEVRERDGIE